jgi:hypothetical protein
MSFRDEVRNETGRVCLLSKYSDFRAPLSPLFLIETYVTWLPCYTNWAVICLRTLFVHHPTYFLRYKYVYTRTFPHVSFRRLQKAVKSDC